MENGQFRKNQRKSVAVFGILLFSGITSLVLSTRSLTGVPERAGLSFFSFFQGIFDGVANAVTGTFNAVSELSALREKFAEAMIRLDELKTIERDLSDLRMENARLREQLGFVQEREYRKIAAEIIAKDPEGLFSTFVINKGSDDGVKKNQAVLAYQNGLQGLVGKVLETSSHSAIVIPLFDANTFVSAKLQRSRYEGLVNGLGSKDFPLVMQYVRKRARDEIQFGDVVVTSGLQSVYPKDIVIGRVNRTIMNDFETSLRLEVEPVIDYGNLEFVFIVEPEGTER